MFLLPRNQLYNACYTTVKSLDKELNYYQFSTSY